MLDCYKYDLVNLTELKIHKYIFMNFYVLDKLNEMTDSTFRLRSYLSFYTVLTCIS